MTIRADPEQLELFGTQEFPLSPRGRNFGLCKAAIAYEAGGLCFRCILYGHIAPYPPSLRIVQEWCDA